MSPWAGSNADVRHSSLSPDNSFVDGNCTGGTEESSEYVVLYSKHKYMLLRDVEVPIIYELPKTQSIEFHFLNGLHEVSRDPMMESHFQGPFFRYHRQSGANALYAALSMRELAESKISPENFLRELRRRSPMDFTPEIAIKQVLDFANHSELGPFDGLLGFSEGASVAANILIEQQRSSTVNPFKFAILMCGVPPSRSGDQDFFLADEFSQIITTPTVHVLGAKDLCRLASLALFNLCASGSASLYEHQQGHQIPRSPAVTKKMAELIRAMFSHVETNN